jgi:predicted thioesterase
MNALDELAVGMAAELNVVITQEMTIGYLVDGMPLVYATPIMVLHRQAAYRQRDNQ